MKILAKGKQCLKFNILKYSPIPNHSIDLCPLTSKKSKHLIKTFNSCSSQLNHTQQSLLKFPTSKSTQTKKNSIKTGILSGRFTLCYSHSNKLKISDAFVCLLLFKSLFKMHLKIIFSFSIIMEGLKTQLKVEAGHIVKVLQKSQAQRMPFEGVQIARSLNRVPLITKFFQTKSEPFVTLCISSQIKTIQQGQQVYEKLEQQPNAIYLILQGKLSVKQNQQPIEVFKTLCYTQQAQKVRKPLQSILQLRRKNNQELFSEKALKTREYEISEFDHFGEVQVIFNIPKRNQKIFAKTECKIMVLKADQLKQILRQQALENNAKFMHYIEVHPYFEDLSPYGKRMLSLIMMKQAFVKGDQLINNGSVIQKVMFMVYGNISVIKKICLNTPNPSCKTNSLTTLKINELTEMQTVGEYECVNQRPSQVTLIAQNFGCYYHVNYSEILKFNHPILIKIKEKALPYPNDNELQFIFRTKLELQTEQMKIQKENKIGMKNQYLEKSSTKPPRFSNSSRIFTKY